MALRPDLGSSLPGVRPATVELRRSDLVATRDRVPLAPKNYVVTDPAAVARANP